MLDKDFVKKIVDIEISDDNVLKELETRAFEEFYFYTSFPRNLDKYPECVVTDVKRALCYQIKHMLDTPDLFDLINSFRVSKISKTGICVNEANSIQKVSDTAFRILAQYGFVSTRIRG